MKKDVNYITLLVVIVVCIISTILLAKSTNIVEDVIYSYNTNSKIDYKVYIFPNDYIHSEYMGKDQTYISDFVEKINIDYDYNMNTVKKLNSSYVYSVDAKITVNHNSTGKELWTETIKLADHKQIEGATDTNVAIKENVEVNFKEINDKVKNFKYQTNIPISAYMDVELKLIDSTTNKEVDKTGISFDLNEDVFEIKGNNIGQNIRNITKEKAPNKIVVLVEAIVSIGSLIYIVAVIYTAIEGNFKKKSYYAKAIYKILKNYGDIVAELVKPIDLDGLKVIDVKNFDQMLDVEEELRIPIMFFETIKNEEGWFVLVHQDMAYRFILRDRLKG